MLASLCRLLLRAIGWRGVFVPPPGPRSVVIVYPHTSNWDFPLGLVWRIGVGIFIRYAAKDSLFAGPLGGFFRRTGGVAINRRERTGMIGQLTEAMARSDEFHIAITPEGTRSLTDHWKSGFYRLATAAQVPVGFGFIDYGKRELGIGGWMTLSGDEAADLETIRAFYADKRALFPEKAGPIRFKS